MTQSEDSHVQEKTASAEPHPGTIKKTGLIRIIRAGGYSLSGLRLAFISEAAFRQECALAMIAFPAAFLLPIGMIERLVLIGVTFLVLIVELLNSAVEAVVDRIGVEAHPLSGQAKDIGSAAVLMALLLWIYAWAEVLISIQW